MESRLPTETFFHFMYNGLSGLKYFSMADQHLAMFIFLCSSFLFIYVRSNQNEPFHLDLRLLIDIGQTNVSIRPYFV